MDARHRGIQVFGWLSVIAGYGLGLLLIRGMFIGITQGFAGRPPAFWIVLGYLLFLAFAVYLFTVGRRATSIAKGSPRPKTRFGWGRMMLGALLIYGAVTSQFHLFPTRHFVKQLEYDNQTQAAAGSVTTIAMYIGCVFLILSGIWKGVRRERIRSTTDKKFLKKLEDWLDSQLEILVLIRYSHAAGNKSFEFFTSFAALSERLHQLGPQTCITSFRRPQLPLRGIVDDAFIDACLSNIPDGSEFVVAEAVRRTAGQHSWFHFRAGETHEELRESLEASRGSPVAVGEYPPYMEDSHDVISGYVPDEDGVARTGVY